MLLTLEWKMPYYHLLGVSWMTVCELTSPSSTLLTRSHWLPFTWLVSFNRKIPSSGLPICLLIWTKCWKSLKRFCSCMNFGRVMTKELKYHLFWVERQNLKYDLRRPRLARLRHLYHQNLNIEVIMFYFKCRKYASQCFKAELHNNNKYDYKLSPCSMEKVAGWKTLIFQHKNHYQYFKSSQGFLRGFYTEPIVRVKF